jgi:hypothetical protein
MLRLVRLWNQLSGNGQASEFEEFEEKGCLIRAASFDLLTVWNVFVELWTSHELSRS